MKTMLTVTEQVSYMYQGGPPVVVSTKYTRLSEDQEQVYQRNYRADTNGLWEKIDIGWFSRRPERSRALLICNHDGVDPRRPSSARPDPPAEETLLEVSFSGDTTPHKDFSIPPEESVRLVRIADLSRVFIRTRKPLQISITIFP